MKAKKADTREKSIKTAILYSVLVLFVIGIAILLRIVVLVKESTYDNLHRYTVVFRDSDKKATVVSFERQSQSLAELNLTSKTSLWPLAKTVGVPYDAIIETPFSENTSLSNIFRQMMWHVTPNVNHMTSYDALRLSWLAKTTPISKIKKSAYAISEDFDKTQLSQFIADAQISQENESISIVNASGQAGLGSALDSLLNVLGATVLSVIGQDTVTPTSQLLYSGARTYTVKRLERLFGFQAKQRSEKGLSDILILIGKDGLPKLFSQNL